MFEGIDFYTSITRARFEEFCSDFFKGSLDPSEKARRDFKNSISNNLLVGGSNRIQKLAQ